MHTLPLEDQIVVAIRRIVRAVDLHSRRLEENFGLTGPQLAALQQVARLAPTTPTVLARELRLSQGTVTGILQRLDQRGLIARTRSETDRRAIIVEATADGRRLLDTAPSLLQDQFRDSLAKLESWERTQILATLQRVAALMDAERLDASPHLVSGAVAPRPGQPRADRS